MDLNGGTAPPVVKWHAAGLAEMAHRSSGGGASTEPPELMRREAAPDKSAPDGRKAVVEALTFVLSTDDVDRHGDMVLAEGWRLEAYLRNPVLLWAHDYRHPAIGRALSVWTEPHRLLTKMEFAPSAFAQEVAALYTTGFQWGVSVGFRPIRWEERRDVRTGAFLGLRYLEQELLEVSAVPVPANRQALRRGASQGHAGWEASAWDGAADPGITWSDVAWGALLSALDCGRG